VRTGSIKLTIDSAFQHVFMVGLAVQRICSSIPLNDLAAYEMEMAVVEAVNNSIEHACHNQPGHLIRVRIDLSEDRLTLVVSDTGETVEYFPEMPALEATDPAHPPERGRGILIIRAVMDEVRKRTDGSLNLLTMVKYLPGSDDGVV
jgi:serine/threonine-protein kinase RsbW